MSSGELQFQTQAFCAKLRILGKEWDTEYSGNNLQQMANQESAKSEEEKKFYQAKRRADNEHRLEILHTKFNKEYFSDAQALKTVLLSRVSVTVLRGGGRPSTGPGFSEPRLPPPPALLESGSVAGANPFNEVADYLENLASRLF